MLFSAFVAAVGLLSLAFPSQANAKVVIPAPAPDGQPWVVAHSRAELVDSSRKDPYNDAEDRKIAYSIFMPIHRDTCTGTADNEYTPKLTPSALNLQFYGDKKAGVFEQLHFESCSAASGETPADHFPLLIFEPAVGTSRFVYNQLARQLSANGAYVVTIDHPYDASIVEFADSSVIENKGHVKLDAFQVNRPVDGDPAIEKAIQTRIDDINSVIKELEADSTLPNLFPGVTFVAGNTRIPTAHLFLLGHGLGGTVATSLGASDKRVLWTLNLSGSTPTLKSAVQAYTIFFGRDKYRSDDDPAWLETRKHIVGPQVEWTYQRAEQFDYSDLPLVNYLVGKKNATARGIGRPYEVMDPGDPSTTFRALSCFVEAYFRDTVLPNWITEPRLPGEDRDKIHRCLGWFGGGMKMHVPEGG